MNVKIASIEPLLSDHFAIKDNIWMTFSIWCCVMSNNTNPIPNPSVMIDTSVYSLKSNGSYQLKKGEDMRMMREIFTWGKKVQINAV